MKRGVNQLTEVTLDLEVEKERRANHDAAMMLPLVEPISIEYTLPNEV